MGIVSCEGELGFRAVRSEFRADGDQVGLPLASAEAIGATEGMAIGITPLD